MFICFLYIFQDAKKVLEQEILQYKENKILVRSYDSFVEESTTPSSIQPNNNACK